MCQLLLIPLLLVCIALNIKFYTSSADRPDLPPRAADFTAGQRGFFLLILLALLAWMGGALIYRDALSVASTEKELIGVLGVLLLGYVCYVVYRGSYRVRSRSILSFGEWYVVTLEGNPIKFWLSVFLLTVMSWAWLILPFVNHARS